MKRGHTPLESQLIAGNGPFRHTIGAFRSPAPP